MFSFYFYFRKGGQRTAALKLALQSVSLRHLSRVDATKIKIKVFLRKGGASTACPPPPCCTFGSKCQHILNNNKFLHSTFTVFFYKTVPHLLTMQALKTHNMVQDYKSFQISLSHSISLYKMGWTQLFFFHICIRHPQWDESVRRGLGAGKHQCVWILQGELWPWQLGASPLPARHQPQSESQTHITI